MASIHDVDDISCNFNGVEVTDFKSFKPEGYNKETTLIKGVHGPTGHQHKHRDPKVTLKVGPDSNILTTADPTAQELAESKDTFTLVFQTPFQVFTCTDCVVDDVDDGEMNEDAQDVTITILPLKIVKSNDNLSQVNTT